MKAVVGVWLCMAVVLAACQPAIPPSAPAAVPPVASQPLPASATAPDTPATPDEPRTLHFQCGDLLTSARLLRDEARLSVSGRDIALPHVPSASGARYDDGKGNALWSNGNDALLTLGGKQYEACTRSERASPWVDAQARGIGFRAVGSEPGWYVEVGQGETPALHAELDYGERQIDSQSLVPLTGAREGFRGMATDGTSFELRITRTPCNDGMSGEAFEASAELLVADRPYKGCGAYLFD
ncbi:MAG: MliC family protein [Luteimonas sp.]